ncbi:hypothetical protein CORC01_11270 [Colletotrichum orchidophilum]|uniref:Cyanovirin-N domain-containing protein n=1 Tax=Colletotrichum orchidophilum TaxID=1209926 RepID=A0A1G4AWA9_9PEZI|nr:uncharacterized protein CORC01_11270 [Colletotrichum orchidophilum]OHE93405.1 hypothetical protein CORC01_11270 [Colletotrichum orchidophilum]
MIIPSISLVLLMAACGMMAAPHEPSTLLNTMQNRAVKKIPANFNASCSDVRFFDPRDLVDEGSKKKDSTPYLVAKCGDGKGGERCSWMPLTACFANADGAIVYQRYGAFFKSCTECKYEHTDGNMRCICSGPKGAVTSVVNLNNFLDNRGGLLGCHRFGGNPIGCNEHEMMAIRFHTNPAIIPDEPDWAFEGGL